MNGSFFSQIYTNGAILSIFFYFSTSPPCVSVREYRGSAHRARGLEYKQKQQSPIPPLSGGEVARKSEEKGRGLFERSEFRSPPTATVATSQKAR